MIDELLQHEAVVGKSNDNDARMCSRANMVLKTVLVRSCNLTIKRPDVIKKNKLAIMKHLYTNSYYFVYVTII